VSRDVRPNYVTCMGDLEDKRGASVFQEYCCFRV
jgi:hypothetical protein